MKILVTGGAGFIGSALVRYLIQQASHEVVVVDKLTYAGNLESLAVVSASPRFSFERVDICDALALQAVFERHQPDAVLHLAAESHVDRSLVRPEDFIQTNIVGTFRLLEVSRVYYQHLGNEQKNRFRFLHVSTDEVFGDLGESSGGLFNEESSYEPSSPYSASKASSDHLVRSWGRSYGLPVLVVNCSNNYGPCQFPEKLIPNMILRAQRGERLLVYGSGLQVRDWLYVDDHVRALMLILERGGAGETYAIGGNEKQTNLCVVQKLCDLMLEREISLPKGVNSFCELIEHVEDRAGHDVCYAIDTTKIELELGWKPEHCFSSGLTKTVDWYLENEIWMKNVLNGSYCLERIC